MDGRQTAPKEAQLQSRELFPVPTEETNYQITTQGHWIFLFSKTSGKAVT